MGTNVSIGSAGIRTHKGLERVLAALSDRTFTAL